MKKIDWNLKADPNTEADNYFHSCVTGEIPSEGEGNYPEYSKKLAKAFMSDEVENSSGAIMATARVVAEELGREPESFTRAEMLMIFSGFKMGEAAGTSQVTPQMLLGAILGRGRDQE